MRHHRKLLRRLRALFPREQRRGVVAARMRGGSGWCVVVGRVVGRCIVGGEALALNSRRCDALQDALRKRAREIGT